jgi:hypothetical protein
MSMKKYFIEKLTGIMRNIDLVERDIIQAATEMDVKKLQKATQSLAEEKELQKAFTKDAVKWCSVEDIVSFRDSPYTWRGVAREILCQHTLEYAYKYEKTVTTSERDLLISTFGYHLRSAKIT